MRTMNQNQKNYKVVGSGTWTSMGEERGGCRRRSLRMEWRSRERSKQADSVWERPQTLRGRVRLVPTSGGDMLIHWSIGHQRR